MSRSTAPEGVSTPWPVPRLIAEIGCNHRGEIATALEMIRIAATDAKVDAVKFQKRNNRELLTPEAYDRPHPNAAFAYGPTYGLHREALEFTIAQHRVLQAACQTYGVAYSSSVWDRSSAREIAGLAPAWIKVPSACNRDQTLLGYLADEYGGELHVSLGMTTRAEEEEIVEYLSAKGRGEDTVLYACTSGYPVAFEDVALLEITRLRETFGGTVKQIGFSGHHLGIAADIAAMTLGAEVIERHFTLDRTWKGTDHAASLEPEGLRKLARDLRHVALALQPKRAELLEVERATRDKLKTDRMTWPASSH
jgi:N-acetylneuraminate synthase